MHIDRETLITAMLPEILGQERVKEELKSALLARRHIILVGPPGVGKTTLARSVAELLPSARTCSCPFRCSPAEPWCAACRAGETEIVEALRPFVRVQGSPDLTAEDLIGDIDPIKALEFGPLSEQAFTPGKIFKANKGILFFDEVNRCTEKLQNALLQALEEGRVTIGSYEVDFPADFLFIGTMNPDDTSTEPLSDVFLDRFDLISMSYPETAALENEIVENRRLDVVRIPPELQQQVIAFVRELRLDKNLERKPSVRASIGVIDRAQTTALIRGHNEVLPEDVAAVIASVLSHRISLKPSVKYLEDPTRYVQQKFTQFSQDHGLGGGDP